MSASSSAQHPLRIGIAGLGNVGAGVVRLLARHAGLIKARTGRDVSVTAVSARDRKRQRDCDLSTATWHDNPLDLVADPQVDVVVELMGGASGAAYDAVAAALKAGKPVVTANKALLATRADDILSLLQPDSALAFEAAVAGGIPVIKTLREGLAANEVRAIYGILNGTCNFIVSEMTRTGRDFSGVLAEAQQKGYAEADPSFDIDGIDAAHKLSILSALAFGGKPDTGLIRIQGIRHVSADDIAFARELGYRIRLLGIARRTVKGIEQSVEPCLVPADSAIAAVEGPLNAVYIDGDFSGKILLTGAGAGGDATASAVVADIIDIARGRRLPLMGINAADIRPWQGADIGARMGRYFIRLQVLDQPGVIADVSAILRDCHVSMESVLQRGRDPGQAVSVILTTHETAQAGMEQAIEKIARLSSVTEPPHLMRIEDFT